MSQETPIPPAPGCETAQPNHAHPSINPSILPQSGDIQFFRLFPVKIFNQVIHIHVWKWTENIFLPSCFVELLMFQILFPMTFPICTLIRDLLPILPFFSSGVGCTLSFTVQSSGKKMQSSHSNNYAQDWKFDFGNEWLYFLPSCLAALWMFQTLFPLTCPICTRILFFGRDLLPNLPSFTLGLGLSPSFTV